ncbi:hypothetical protein ACFSUS_26145 [Spirosoma soli]|uniref:DUF4625 domain-containing protein n=1 Tax=Spirosoma soli TaxID=1770529 RepID=A0ABW5MAU6_9BACT
MKKYAFLLVVLLLNCSRKNQVPTPGVYQLRVDNQTDTDIVRVTAYHAYEPALTFVDLGPILKHSVSGYVPASDVHLTLCANIDLALANRTLHRSEDMDCRLADISVATPGRYTLRITKLANTTFDAVIEKD